jgi:hypothetical protein
MGLNHPKNFVESLYKLSNQGSNSCYNHYKLLLERGLSFKVNYEQLTEFGTEHKARNYKLGYCYYNTYHLARASCGRIRYTEGFAALMDMPVCVPHAWGTDQEGNVLDPTWKMLMEAERSKLDADTCAAVYFGVPLSLQSVQRFYEWYRQNFKKSIYCVFVDNPFFGWYLRSQKISFSEFCDGTKDQQDSLESYNQVQTYLD